jgi:hypothetical protein
MIYFAKNRYEKDHALIDPWSGIHFISGILIRLLGINQTHMTWLAVLWEIFENSTLGRVYWKLLGEFDYRYDSLANISSDIIFVHIGWYTRNHMNNRQYILLIPVSFVYFYAYENYLWNVEIASTVSNYISKYSTCINLKESLLDTSTLLTNLFEHIINSDE